MAMLIDAHQHFWHPARGDYGWMENAGAAPIARPFQPTDLAPHLVKAGISKTVLVQAAPSLEETEYLLGIADSHEMVAKVVGWIDFENRDQLRHLKRLAKHPKFSGVRPMIQDLPDPLWMLRADIAWAYEALVELDLTFDALGFPLHLDSFVKLFKRYPQMRCVVDHGMKPQIRHGAFQPWADGLERVASETNAFCKLSGLVTEAAADWNVETLRPYVNHILKVFGPKRVMWGSDWPVLNLNANYQSWLDSARELVPPEMHLDVFANSAKRFYNIEEEMTALFEVR